MAATKCRSRKATQYFEGRLHQEISDGRSFLQMFLWVYGDNDDDMRKKDKYLSSTIFILDLEEHIDFVWVKPTLTKSRTNKICGEKERKQKQKEPSSSSHNELLCLKSFSWKSKGGRATLCLGDKLDREFCLQGRQTGIKRQLFCEDKLLRECFHGTAGLGMK